ncbi:MAG: hypothetical protein QW390_03535 [Candidatus Bathyarchaeia archaeon]
MALEARYKLDIRRVEKAIKTRKDSTEGLKGVLGARRIAQMKKEAVECPVLLTTVSFIECFSCPNFIRRVKGVIHCKGEPLPRSQR